MGDQSAGKTATPPNEDIAGDNTASCFLKKMANSEKS
jgi:hypothetical protein